MDANVGDRIVVRGHRVGEHERDGESWRFTDRTEVRLFLVRWSADGHVGMVFPGSDVTIERHFEGHSARESAEYFDGAGFVT